MTIKTAYEQHYKKIHRTYPSVFALKVMLGKNPRFGLRGHYQPGDTIIDIGFGDGRDLNLFLDLGLKVTGVEPSAEVVKHTRAKFIDHPNRPTILEGTNMQSGAASDAFKIVYSAGAIYYMPDKDHSISDALKEVYRVCQPGGHFVSTFARSDTHVMVDAERVSKNVYILEDPYYQFRKGQYYHVYHNQSEIYNDLRTAGFQHILIHDYDVDWFGTRETLFLVACQK